MKFRVFSIFCPNCSSKSFITSSSCNTPPPQSKYQKIALTPQGRGLLLPQLQIKTNSKQPERASPFPTSSDVKTPSPPPLHKKRGERGCVRLISFCFNSYSIAPNVFETLFEYSMLTFPLASSTITYAIPYHVSPACAFAFLIVY